MKNSWTYLVESHGQSTGDGEALAILEATFDGREVADGQVLLLRRLLRRLLLLYLQSQEVIVVTGR